MENHLVTVFPSVFANDGTGLKLAIELDPREKKNVGLTVKVDIPFVKSNPRPSPEFSQNEHSYRGLSFFFDNFRQQHQSSLCVQ